MNEARPEDGEKLTVGDAAEARAEERRVRGFKLRRDLPPFLAAGFILYFVLRGKNWEEIRRALTLVNPPLFLLGAGVYSLGHLIINGTSYRLLYNWFLVRIRTLEMIKVYAAAMIPQTLLGPLGQVTILIYMIRKKRLRVWPALGIGFFFSYCDTWMVGFVLTVALFLKPRTESLVYLWYGLTLAGLAFATWYLPLGGGKHFLPRLYNSPLLLIFRAARRGHYIRFLGLRLAWPAIQVCAHLVALSAMGIHAPLGAVIIIVTLMTLTSFLPVTVLGFGAPNWAAEYFSPYVAPGHAPAETAIAYGLLFQTAFFLGRLFLGSLFAIPFWREVTRQHQDLQYIRHHSEKNDLS